MTFYPKRSFGVLALTLFSLTALVIAGFQWLAVALIVGLVGFGVPLIYTFGKSELVLRSGLRRRRLPYARIRSAERRASKRFEEVDSVLVTEAGGQTLRFAPANPEAFLKALVENAPHVIVDPPIAGRPAPAAEDRLAPAAEDRPAPAAEDRPAPAAEDRPAPAAEDRPAPAAEDRPAPH